MSKSKTVKCWLELAPAEWGESALQLTKKSEQNLRVTSMSHALQLAFDWSNTPEGYNYWSHVFNTTCAQKDAFEIVYKSRYKWRKLALRNLYAPLLAISVGNPANTILHALDSFWWERSPEGYQFWSDVFEKLKNKKS